MDVAFIDLTALPIPATFSSYQAALMHVEFAGDDFGNPQWTAGMQELKEGVMHFARRWSIGSM